MWWLFWFLWNVRRFSLEFSMNKWFLFLLQYSKRISERTFAFQFVGNASYTVDTFFFIRQVPNNVLKNFNNYFFFISRMFSLFRFASDIYSMLFLHLKSNSGLLVTLLFLRGKNSTKSSNDTSFITGAKHSVFLVIYRYIRLTPVYFMVIIINAVTLKWVYFNHGNEIIFSHFNQIKLENSRWWKVKLLIFHSNNFLQVCLQCSCVYTRIARPCNMSKLLVA